MIGQTISHYKILEKIGAGGMGVVYKAEDLTLGRTVALKFVSGEVAADSTVKERLIREAKACASLNHPNITTVYEFVEEGDKSFIAMEFVEGKTLQELVREKRLEPRQVIEIGLQAADGLEAAHKKGIIHRDLKSANIMLDESGRVKVMDFGLARFAHGSLLTRSGVTLGTAAYMSPEQAKGEVVDARSDIYSMGVVLYELATGELPFREAHQLAVMYAILNETPDPPRQLDPDIPAELEAVILKAIEKDPEQRYSSFAQMGYDLEQIRDRRPGTQSTVTQVHTPVAAPSVAKRPRRSKVLALSVPAAVVAVALGAWLVFGPNSGPGGETSAQREVARAHKTRALSFLNTNQRQLAVVELERAVQADPTYSPAWSTLAALSIQSGDFDQAISQSRKAIEADEGNSIAYYNLAYALEEKGELDAARSAYAEAIRMDSTFTRAYSALGNLYIKLGKPEDAVQVLQAALRLTPESQYLYLIHKNLGKAYFELGRYVQAKASLQRSLEAQPAVVPETLYFLAMTYEAQGNKGASADTWKKYIEVEKDPAKRSEAQHRLQQLMR